MIVMMRFDDSGNNCDGGGGNYGGGGGDDGGGGDGSGGDGSGGGDGGGGGDDGGGGDGGDDGDGGGGGDGSGGGDDSGGGDGSSGDDDSGGDDGSGGDDDSGGGDGTGGVDGSGDVWPSKPSLLVYKTLQTYHESCVYIFSPKPATFLGQANPRSLYPSERYNRKDLATRTQLVKRRCGLSNDVKVETMQLQVKDDIVSVTICVSLTTEIY